MGLIKECIEIKRREREEKHIEEIKRKALAEADRRLEIVLKTALSIVLCVVGTLLLALSALDGETNTVTFMTYARIILGMMCFISIPLVWIYRRKSRN